MKKPSLPLALMLSLALPIGCGDCGPEPDPDGGQKQDAGPNPDAGTVDAGTDAGPEDTLYLRLGGRTGIEAVVGDFIARVLGDAKINGYFLNADLNATRLSTCLANQIGAATGGPETYPGPSDGPDADGCRNMRDSHAGLGISTRDFTDLVAHLVDALTAAGVASADIATISGALAPLAADIVEDANNDQSIYQRIGRKPAIELVVGDAIGRILDDPKINGYFMNAGLDGARLGTCLVRQFCEATGGPCNYGAANALETTLLVNDELLDCRDMATVHFGLGISQVDQDDLKAHIVDALVEAGVAGADLAAIQTVLDGTDDLIVEDATNDATIYQRIGRKPAVAAVVADAVGRILGDSTVNGYFLNEGLDAARLTTCLVRQFCDATGGPCRYAEANALEAALVVNDEVANCRGMIAAHAGLGISQVEQDALKAHIAAAATAAGVGGADLAAIAGVLDSTDAAIVEDANSDDNVYQRIGRKPAIEAVVSDSITRILGDATVNAYFLNAGLDAGRLTTCLVRQFCDATGGPCRYGAANAFETALVVNDQVANCRSMTAAHAGLGISRIEQDALKGHVAAAAQAAGVAGADLAALAGILDSTDAAIIEDANNNTTIYQRAGRKPGLLTVLTAEDDPGTALVNEAGLIPRVLADVSLNGYFTGTDEARLTTCLQRQLCEATGGPCVYGAANAFETALVSGEDINDCLDMATSHAGVRNATLDRGIRKQEFDDLVAHLVSAMTVHGVGAADRQTIVDALAGTCEDIVNEGTCE